MEFPQNFGKICRRIKYLEMENTFIRDFPSALTSLLDLRHLQLSNKKTCMSFTAIEIPGAGWPQHAAGRYFERESSWDFYGSKRHAYQDEKERFHLRNSLWTFPTNFSNFVGLVKLETADVGLADFPEALGQLRSIKILDVSKNNLSILKIPQDIETISSLTHLLSAFNMIAELPENLYTLQSLHTLDV